MKYLAKIDRIYSFLLYERNKSLNRKIRKRKQRCSFAHSRISALRTKPPRITHCALFSPSRGGHVYLGIRRLFAFSPCVWFAFLLPFFIPGPQPSYFPNIRGHPHQKFDLPRPTDQRALVIPLSLSEAFGLIIIEVNAPSQMIHSHPRS